MAQVMRSTRCSVALVATAWSLVTPPSVAAQGGSATTGTVQACSLMTPGCDGAGPPTRFGAHSPVGGLVGHFVWQSGRRKDS